LRENCCEPLCDYPPQCNEPNQDPCPCNLEGTGCAVESPIVIVNPPPIPYNITLIFGLNDYLQTPLTQEQKDWIHASTENYEFALEVLDIRQQLTTVYDNNNYPGMYEGLDYNWWSDEAYLDNDFSLGFGPGYDEFSNLTKAEKLLVALFPAAALEIRNNKQPATDQTHQLFPHVLNNGSHYHLNDKADAFRHAFFNAINTRDVSAQMPSMGGPIILGRDIVRLFGAAHESETYQHLILEKEMDIYNNEVGVVYCIPCYPNTHDNNSISNGIMQLLNLGTLVYLNPIDYSEYSDSESSFWDDPNTSIPDDGHHGIHSSTLLTPTNQ
tara:strand:+ start:3078 stop:4055 length:978 start_codon:yes stop_codon:yes gene_type:complete